MKIVRLTLLLALFSLGILSVALANNPPKVSGINCQEANNETIYVSACAGEKLCFTVCTSDADTADKVTISGSTGIDGATFDLINKGDKRELGQFCWTPSDAQASKGPYSFVVTATDNANPVSGTSKRTFVITVKETPKAIYDTIISGCGEAGFSATKTGNIAISQYMWNLNGRIVVHNGGESDTVYHAVKYPGKKPFTLTLIGANGCNKIYEDTFTNPESVSIKTTDNLSVCAGETLKLNALVTNAIGAFYVEWSTGNKFYKEGGTSSITVGMRDTFVFARVKDAHCYHADTTFIRVNQAVEFDLGNDIHIFPGQEHKFRPVIFRDTLDADTVILYNWYKNELTNPISTLPYYVANESATYFLTISDSLGCKSIDSVTLRVDSNTSSIIENIMIENNQLYFQIYPNPTQKSIHLLFNLELAYVEITDVAGHLVFSSQVANKQSIEVSALPNGAYFLHLKPFSVSSNFSRRQIFFKN